MKNNTQISGAPKQGERVENAGRDANVAKVLSPVSDTPGTFVAEIQMGETQMRPAVVQRRQGLLYFLASVI